MARTQFEIRQARNSVILIIAIVVAVILAVFAALRFIPGAPLNPQSRNESGELQLTGAAETIIASMSKQEAEIAWNAASYDIALDVDCDSQKVSRQFSAADLQLGSEGWYAAEIGGRTVFFTQNVLLSDGSGAMAYHLTSGLSDEDLAGLSLKNLLERAKLSRLYVGENTSKVDATAIRGFLSLTVKDGAALADTLGELDVLADANENAIERVVLSKKSEKNPNVYALKLEITLPQQGGLMERISDVPYGYKNQREVVEVDWTADTYPLLAALAEMSSKEYYDANVKVTFTGLDGIPMVSDPKPVNLAVRFDPSTFTPSFVLKLFGQEILIRDNAIASGSVLVQAGDGLHFADFCKTVTRSLLASAEMTEDGSYMAALPKPKTDVTAVLNLVQGSIETLLPNTDISSFTKLISSIVKIENVGGTVNAQVNDDTIGSICVSYTFEVQVGGITKSGSLELYLTPADAPVEIPELPESGTGSELST